MKGNPGRVTAAQPLSQVSHWALGKPWFFDESGQMRLLFFVQNSQIWSLFWRKLCPGAVARKVGQFRQKITYFPRNPCEHWEGLSGAPAPSLRWANAEAGASLRWVQKNRSKSWSSVGAKQIDPKDGLEPMTTLSTMSSLTLIAFAVAFSCNFLIYIL